ncbi:hypothetical protein ACJX0J_019316 [Zea mays]
MATDGNDTTALLEIRGPLAEAHIDIYLVFHLIAFSRICQIIHIISGRYLLYFTCTSYYNMQNKRSFFLKKKYCMISLSRPQKEGLNQGITSEELNTQEHLNQLVIIMFFRPYSFLY